MKILLVCKSKAIEVLGLMYISAIAKQNKHECKIVDRDNAFRCVETFNPDIVGFSIMTGDQETFKGLARAIRNDITLKRPKIIVGGAHPTFFPQDCEWADQIVRGDAEGIFAKIIGSRRKYDSIDKIPHPDRTDFPDMKIRDFISSRGCPNSCLVGDTIVNTPEGDFPIKELCGKSVKILTRDHETEEPVYIDAINIGLREKDAELVRVHFDDGSHIDCTPDHKFKVFRYKNQYHAEDEEFDIEAKDLKPKEQVRAVSYYYLNGKRLVVSTKRTIRKFHSDLVMEASIGRKLYDGEIVHHKDRNPSNNKIDNLVLTTKKYHVPDWHPEVSERMKLNNPVWNISKEALSERAKNIFSGRKQSIEERLMRRKMQLGSNNSNYKGGLAALKQKKPSRIPEVNHKVVSVEKLNHREDVYCMEVPGNHWFYANKVLVHNCYYCYNSAWYKLFPDVERIRTRDVDDVIVELMEVNPKFAYFQDSCFGLNINWMRDFADKYSRHVKAPCHVHLRPKQATDERVALLQKSNCVSVKIALETASDRLRKLINRGNTNNEDAIKASKLLRKWSIALIMQNILGLPTATIEEDLETLEVNILCRPAYAWCSIFQPYPKTDLADICEKNGWYTGDYSEIGDNFFDRSLLNFSDEHKEQIEVLQRVFALCTEMQYLPKKEELTYQNLPKLIHKIMRRVGDRRMFPSIEL